MFTYSHADTPLGQSEGAYYLSYFIKGYKLKGCMFSKEHNTILNIINL